jgi:hypothetical protein
MCALRGEERHRSGGAGLQQFAACDEACRHPISFTRRCYRSFPCITAQYRN